MALRLKKWRNPNNNEVRIYVNGFDGDQSSPYFVKQGNLLAKLEIPREVKNPERMRREVDSFLYEEFSLQLDDLEWTDIHREAGW